MRAAVLIFVGLGLFVISAACGGPGPTDDACTSLGNTCVNFNAKPMPACGEALPQYPCQASGPGYVCCSPIPGGGGGSGGTGGTSGSGGAAGSGADASKG